ncbi:MAG: hypothetical protein ACKV22_09760 [Bryobacteraceae bacterium]
MKAFRGLVERLLRLERNRPQSHPPLVVTGVDKAGKVIGAWIGFLPGGKSLSGAAALEWYREHRKPLPGPHDI